MEKIIGYVVMKHDNKHKTLLGISTSQDTAIENLEDYIKESPWSLTWAYNRYVFDSNVSFEVLFTSVNNPEDHVRFTIERKHITIDD